MRLPRWFVRRRSYDADVADAEYMGLLDRIGDLAERCEGLEQRMGLVEVHLGIRRDR